MQISNIIKFDRVAIIGKLGSGKTTFADSLSKYGYVKMSFAKKLKDIVIELFPESDKSGDKNRHLLQSLAEKIKEIDENVWVHYIDDCRFYNEYKALKDIGFKFIYLDYSDDIILDHLMKRYPLNYNDHISRRGHVSELLASNREEALKLADIVINQPPIID